MTSVRPDSARWWSPRSAIVVSVAASVLVLGVAAPLPAAPVSLWAAGLVSPAIQMDAARDSGVPLGIESARAVRKAVRKAVRHIAWWAHTWVNWTWQVLLFAAIALLMPLFDRDLLRTGREQGFGRLRIAVALALAVYVRLLIDRRSPILGKILLVCAVIYGMITADFVPDTWIPVGFLDDILAAGLASRFFMWLCPDDLVAEQAANATQARERSLQRHVPIDGTGAA